MGSRHHAWKTLAERMAGVAISLGKTLVLLALAVLGLLLVALVVVMSLPGVDRRGGGAGWLFGLWLMLGGPGHAPASWPGGRQNRVARPDDAHLDAAGADRQAGSPDGSRWIDYGRGMEIRSSCRPWHRAQMGVYFLLVEKQLGIRPPHGFIVCGDGTRHRIENSDELRGWVLDLAGQIRAAKAAVTSRSRSSRCPASAAHVGCVGTAGRLCHRRNPAYPGFRSRRSLVRSRYSTLSQQTQVRSVPADQGFLSNCAYRLPVLRFRGR